MYTKHYVVHLGGCGLVAKSCPTLATPWTVAYQAPLSKGFTKQEYWSGLPFPSPGDLPDQGREDRVSCIAGRFFTNWAMREVHLFKYLLIYLADGWNLFGWCLVYTLNTYSFCQSYFNKAGKNAYIQKCALISYVAGMNVKWCTHFGKRYGTSSNS